MSAVYFLLLPAPTAFAPVRLDAYDFVVDSDDEVENLEDDDDHLSSTQPFASPQRAPPTAEGGGAHLTVGDKLLLLKPLLIPYCLPLFSVYFAEYTINQGETSCLEASRLQFVPGLSFALFGRSGSRVSVPSARLGNVAGAVSDHQEVRTDPSGPDSRP